ncbi:MAG: hypothetical protein OXG04_28710 [Acidobacteria bacterium]|nr:hypothetical protein [Acidobacteriota bacterium]
MRGLRRGVVPRPGEFGHETWPQDSETWKQEVPSPLLGTSRPLTTAARDGSWTTGALQPATWEVVAFDEPGTFQYHCTEHPWAVGEITVEP